MARYRQIAIPPASTGSYAQVSTTGIEWMISDTTVTISTVSTTMQAEAPILALRIPAEVVVPVTIPAGMYRLTHDGGSSVNVSIKEKTDGAHANCR